MPTADNATTKTHTKATVAALDEYLQAHERRNGGTPNRFGMREIA